MDVYVSVTNDQSRLTADRFAYLVTQVDTLLAGAGPDADRTDDDALTRLAGPCATPITAETQMAVWLIRVAPAQVVRLQAALARARRAYGDAAITWAETTLRDIQAAPSQDQPVNPPGEGPPAPADPPTGRPARLGRRHLGSRMTDPAAVLTVDVRNWFGDVLVQGFRAERTAGEFGAMLAEALTAQHPGSSAGVRVVDLGTDPDPLGRDITAPAPAAGA